MINPEGLQAIVGQDWVITDRSQMEGYLCDETYFGVRPEPAQNLIVVKPKDAGEISRVLRWANETGTAIYPRGGGTGLVGAAIPTRDGAVLSLERLDLIEEMDKDNLMVVAQAGVTLGDLLHAVEAEGLLFPPHPGDEGAQLGGLVASNAGGTRAVKYGVIRNYVKGIEVVLPTGGVVTMGGKLLKNNTGLDLMHLLIDSEGILGIITKVVLRLYPRFAGTATLLISFDDRHAAIRAVPAILQSDVIPMAIEYTERDLMETTSEYLGIKWPAEKGQAFLMIIVTGMSQDDVYAQCERISEICETHGAVDTLIAERREEQADILKLRSEVGPAMKPRLADALDITVPPAAVATILDEIDGIAVRYNTRIPVVGHAGDGNLHPNLLNDLQERGTFGQAKREIYEATARLGGVVSGEHGIGKTRLAEFSLFMDPKSRELQRGIKKLFDPNGILNPATAID